MFRQVLLRMRNVSDKISGEDQNTRFTFSNFCFFFFLKIVPFMRKCGKLQYCRAGRRWLAIWCSRFACWIPKATNTHSKHLILIALPQQQWLRERASVLGYTFSASLVPQQLRHRNMCSVSIKSSCCVPWAIALRPFPTRIRVWFCGDQEYASALETNSPDVISHVNLFSDHCYVKHTEVGFQGLWYLALNSQV